MRTLVALFFLSIGSAGAQAVGEPSGGLARERALLVPSDSIPPAVRATVEREALGRRYVVLVMHIGNTDIYEGDFGEGRVRVSEDGRIVGRDRGPARP